MPASPGVEHPGVLVHCSCVALRIIAYLMSLHVSDRDPILRTADVKWLRMR